MITAIAIMLLTNWSHSQEMNRALFMTPAKAKQRWGSQKFSPEMFKSGDPKIRSAMAADAAKKNALKGKTISEARELLGKPDGYFFSDRILSYQIQPYSKESGESWQVVFIPQENSDLIESVKIHKKCCYKE